ncbi:hypothetical protein ACFWCA_19105 [Streptomyces phaeochromogenes]|uniref:hypothetical protein n=1 Tax=Streptomyces phaeochromogenes TaxID=1923 RepID=UPI0036866D4B
MLTATDRAEAMALQVLISARLDNGHVVTHDLVDAVMSRDADTEQGKANKQTVRRIIRARAASENVRVIFTDVERYWAIREQLHHMDGDEVHALHDSISDGGDADPRGDDRALIDAISVRLSNRISPRRLDGCNPVSVRLWREPHPRPAEGEEQHHVRVVDSGTPEVIPTRDALAEIAAAMTEPGKDAVRRVSESLSHTRIVYRESARGTVDLRPLVKGQALLTCAPRLTVQELVGPVDDALLASYAEMYAAVDNGTAIPVRADMVRPGMDVITIARPEGHPVDIVMHHNGPGTVCVAITGGGGGTYAPDFHLMVTVDSLTRLYGSVVRPAAETSPCAHAPAEAFEGSPV